MNKKRESLSKEIDHVVVLCFGIAFFLIYTASAILLFITEEDISQYYGKAIGMFVVYLALYIIASFLVTQRIGELFVPLDRVANKLIREDKFSDSGENGIQSLADSLRAQSEQVDALSRELETTQSDLDDAFTESRQNRHQQTEMAKTLIQDLETLQDREAELIHSGDKLLKLLKDAMPLESGIKEQKDELYEQMQQIDSGLRESERQYQDTAADFEELGGTFQLLGNMQTDAGDLLENIYNEMTALQSLSTQTNLYAMNTALDTARSGSITVSTISALDEIKELTGKINEKTDDVLLLLIRTRNALKLAMDQSGECREKGEECSRAFEESKTALQDRRQEIEKMLSAGEALTDDVAKLGNTLYEAQNAVQKRRDEQSKCKEGLEKMCE
ncbi:MAG: hypothetical protein IKM88_07820, partial [Lachnospiraceae bacterium]|nr:hypothetical protein [Lachnospiraceae bacterium]